MHVHSFGFLWPAAALPAVAPSAAQLSAVQPESAPPLVDARIPLLLPDKKIQNYQVSGHSFQVSDVEVFVVNNSFCFVTQLSQHDTTM